MDGGNEEKVGSTGLLHAFLKTVAHICGELTLGRAPHLALTHVKSSYLITGTPSGPFTAEETEAQRDGVTCPRPLAGRSGTHLPRQATCPSACALNWLL